MAVNSFEPTRNEFIEWRKENPLIKLPQYGNAKKVFNMGFKVAEAGMRCDLRNAIYPAWAYLKGWIAGRDVFIFHRNARLATPSAVELDRGRKSA